MPRLTLVAGFGANEDAAEMVGEAEPEEDIEP
jgi:hypothetical protein